MTAYRYRQYLTPKNIATVLLCLLTLIQLFPIVYMIMLSFKQLQEIFQYPPQFLPEKIFYLENYQQAFKMAPLSRFLINSFIVSAAICVLQVVFAILAAFALARLEFRGKTFIFAVIIATIMVPFEITLIPNYFTIAKLGLIDSYAALILPFAASGFGVFLLYQFFKTIPQELEEAAIVDGASSLRFLWQFVVPLSKGAITSFAVFSFITAWNQYLWPLIVTQSTDMRTVQIALSMFRSENEANSWGLLMAATVILLIPAVIVFIFSQKHFVNGITMSGMKRL